MVDHDGRVGCLGCLVGLILYMLVFVLGLGVAAAFILLVVKLLQSSGLL